MVAPTSVPQEKISPHAVKASAGREGCVKESPTALVFLWGFCPLSREIPE